MILETFKAIFKKDADHELNILIAKINKTEAKPRKSNDYFNACKAYNGG